MGWLQNFKCRNNIKFYKFKGESKNAENIDCDKEINSIKHIISK